MIKEKTPTRKQIIHRLNEGDRYLMALICLESKRFYTYSLVLCNYSRYPRHMIFNLLKAVNILTC